MRGHWAFFLVAFLLAPASLAQEQGVGDTATSGDTFLLRDGREVRLSSVCADDTDAARTFLTSAIHRKQLVLHDASKDRYGRINAHVFDGERSLGEYLVRAGQAYVCPAEKSTELAPLMKAETEARAAHRGFWATARMVPAKDAATLVGRYAFVSGTVTEVSRQRNKITVAFGDKPFFKVILAARFLRPLRKRGLDPFTLKGTRLYVRGWVIDDGGATVIMANDHQVMSSLGVVKP